MTPQEEIRMNKKDIVKELSVKHNITNDKMKDILNDFIGLIGDELSKRNKVQLPGFGTFESREVKERMSRNPQTGESILVPAHFSPKFKPGKQLKNKVYGENN